MANNIPLQLYPAAQLLPSHVLPGQEGEEVGTKGLLPVALYITFRNINRATRLNFSTQHS